MCGICGIIKKSPDTGLGEKVSRMRDEMAHRGPDGYGLWVNGTGCIGLGHRRLRIIDLTENGKQPMQNSKGTLQIVFNGEIYNYIEIRQDLQSKGYRFKSQSDTEVILYAYQEWGRACLDQFVGIFAFCIWDERRKTLFAARDHVGVKPFYFSFDGDSFTFSSEMKGILAIHPDLRQPNWDAIYDWVTFTEFDHNKTTFFRNIYQLKPGHFIEFDFEEFSISDQIPFWKFSIQEIRESQNSEIDLTQRFSTLFHESIAFQMRSDVPVGAFLSGGLDSTSIVAIASQLTDEPMRTFSSVYSQIEYNEEKFIEIATKQFVVKHKQTTPKGDKFFTDLEKFIWIHEQPPNGPGPFSEWCVAELAHRDVVVLLSGQGPDEMLGGYHPMFQPYLATIAREMLKSNRGSFADFKEELNLIADLTGSRKEMYWLSSMLPNWMEFQRKMKRIRRNQFLSKGFLQYKKSFNDLETEMLPIDLAGLNLLDKYLVKSTLGGQLRRLLHYGDRNSMAFSLEARVPFLDHRLIEYSLALPVREKINKDVTKNILREAMRNKMPEEIRTRKDKKGFPTPLRYWLIEHEAHVRDILNSQRVRERGIFKPTSVDRFVDLHMKGKYDFTFDLFRLLTLEKWFQIFID